VGKEMKTKPEKACFLSLLRSASVLVHYLLCGDEDEGGLDLGGPIVSVR